MWHFCWDDFWRQIMVVLHSELPSISKPCGTLCLNLWNCFIDHQTSTICRCISCWTFAFPMRFFVWLQGKTSKHLNKSGHFCSEQASATKWFQRFRFFQTAWNHPPATKLQYQTFRILRSLCLFWFGKCVFLFMIKNPAFFRDFHTNVNITPIGCRILDLIGFRNIHQLVRVTGCKAVDL